MTVKEIIAILKTFPQDANVYMADMLPIVAIHNCDNSIIITDEI